MMLRPVRLIAGILTLSALAFSLAEAVVASTCAPMPEMNVGTMADAGEPSAVDCMPAPHRTMPDPGNEGMPHCPFGPMTVAQGCTAVASLPAPAVFFDVSPSGALATITFDDGDHDLLLATVLFHPPKS